jgi:REP element-mobilizing transposase RayT
MSATGWRSRGYLPHCDERGLVQHVIFGLDDALPTSTPSHLVDPAKRAVWADHEFDMGKGACLLRKPTVAKIVETALLHGDGKRYALAAWCVMPTHVHVVMERLGEVGLATILHTWKSFSAHEINKAERRSGALWRREYFDRFMRTSEQFEWTIRYVEMNPVSARFVEKPEEWEFSSSRWRRA